MGRPIIKLATQDGDRYLEWSTICDAPTTYGMTLAEFKEWYRAEYGSAGMAELEERLRRVEATGTSSYEDGSVADIIVCNRAGAEETCMTLEEIVDWYCVKRGTTKKPRGSA